VTGALLDRLTHQVHILEMNGESYRFKDSVRRLGKPSTRHRAAEAAAPTEDLKPSQETTQKALDRPPPRANLQPEWYTLRNSQ
jgi:hypothetical protein